GSMAAAAQGTLEKPLARNLDLLEQVVGTLSECRYFQTMKKSVLREVVKKGKYIEVPGETRLIHESDLDDDIYFLLEGSLRIVSGENMVLRRTTPGDTVGELAVVSDSPRSADVYTEGPAKLVKISSSVIKRGNAEPARTIQFYTLFSHIMAAKLN